MLILALCDDTSRWQCAFKFCPVLCQMVPKRFLAAMFVHSKGKSLWLFKWLNAFAWDQRRSVSVLDRRSFVFRCKGRLEHWFQVLDLIIITDRVPVWIRAVIGEIGVGVDSCFTVSWWISYFAKPAWSGRLRSSLEDKSKDAMQLIKKYMGF